MIKSFHQLKIYFLIAARVRLKYNKLKKKKKVFPTTWETLTVSTIKHVTTNQILIDNKIGLLH